MRIAIHDAEQDHMPGKTFPNYALMKISAWHKTKGDSVEWFIAFDVDKYDRIYSSKVFDFTPVNVYLPSEKTVKGGTGYGLYGELPSEMDAMYPDYSIYPSCDYAIGFLTRGCIRNCPWCVVPKKEGAIRPYRTIEQIARRDTDKIVFMDNNVLACEYGIAQLKELSVAGYSVDFNQGLDIRLITAEIAEILKQIKWTRHIRFSCDSESQLAYFERWMPTFKRLKIASRMYVYLLVTNDIADAEKRVHALHGMNRSFTIYAQSERNIGKEITAAQDEFSLRYIYSGIYKTETWAQYCLKRGFENYISEVVG